MVPHMRPHTRKSTYSEVNKHALWIAGKSSFIVSKFQVFSFKIVKFIYEKIPRIEISEFTAPYIFYMKIKIHKFMTHEIAFCRQTTEFYAHEFK